MLPCRRFFLREPLKIQKSRLATKAKAEFAKVNEHFAEGA
jgi:hypothetical protein